MRRFLLMMVWLLLWSCGTDRKAGGTWDEAGNAVAISVTDAQGNPAIGARVTLLNRADWSKRLFKGLAPELESLLTDSLGQVQLKLLPGNYRIEIEQQSFVAEKVMNSDDSVLHVQLEKASQIEGRLAGQKNTWPQKLRLWGTSYVAQVNADGSFAFQGIPQGSWNITAIDSLQARLFRQAVVRVNDTLQLGELIEESAAQVLLEDFSDGNDVNRYHELTQAGWWFCGGDGTSQVVPENIAQALEVSTDKPELGTVAHIQFLISDTVQYAYAICGVDIGKSHLRSDYDTYDMTALDSISFWAKGNGTLHLQLVSVLGESEGSIVRSPASFTLDSAWQWIRIKPSDFDFGARSWLELAPFVNGLVFMNNENSEFWIDEIQLHGVDPTELFPQLKVQDE